MSEQSLEHYTEIKSIAQIEYPKVSDGGELRALIRRLVEKYPIEIEALRSYAESKEILSEEEKSFLTPHSKIIGLLDREPPRMNLKRMDLSEIQEVTVSQPKLPELKKK